jgi:hypothetical protein
MLRHCRVVLAIPEASLAHMKVFRAYRIVEGAFVQDWLDGSNPSGFSPGDIIGTLTNLRRAADPVGPQWTIGIRLSEGPKAQTIGMPFEEFMTEAEYRASFSTPISVASLQAAGGNPTLTTAAAQRRVWFFRDGVYIADSPVLPQDMEEVAQLVKAFHSQRDLALKRLRDEVANHEATEAYVASGVVRQPLPDDVKLLVWARDGGACVRCGARSKLHFDHIIPLAKGGSDSVENIQILCERCNLLKGSSLV